MARSRAFPRRSLSPFLWRAGERSKKSKTKLAVAAGVSAYTSFFDLLRAEKIPASPLNLARLHRVATAVAFPIDDLFLDGPAR